MWARRLPHHDKIILIRFSDHHTHRAIRPVRLRHHDFEQRLARVADLPARRKRKVVYRSWCQPLDHHLVLGSNGILAAPVEERPVERL